MRSRPSNGAGGNPCFRRGASRAALACAAGRSARCQGGQEFVTGRPLRGRRRERICHGASLSAIDGIPVRAAVRIYAGRNPRLSRGLSGERGASGSAAWVPSWMASGRDPVSTVWMPTWHVPQSGITLMPSVEITSASFGTGTAPIVPTVLMRSPWIITLLSRMGLPPKPSTSVPPMRALRRPDCALAAGA